jgi:hypothetical protein
VEWRKLETAISTVVALFYFFARRQVLPPALPGVFRTGVL